MRRAWQCAVVLLALALPGALAACSGTLTPGVEGSGQEAAERREVAAFSRIDLAGQTDVTVSPGDTSVTVRGDDNLIGEVETTVDNGTLTIDEQQPLAPRAGLVVDVTTPTLEGAALHGSGELSAQDVVGDTFDATLDGSGDLTLDAVDTARLTADLSGSGDLRAGGRSEQVQLTVGGSGEADMGDVTARDVMVDVSGSGDALVNATETLRAVASGSGDVVYAGDPPDVEQDASGSGEIRPQ